MQLHIVFCHFFHSEKLAHTRGLINFINWAKVSSFLKFLQRRKKVTSVIFNLFLCMMFWFSRRIEREKGSAFSAPEIPPQKIKTGFCKFKRFILVVAVAYVRGVFSFNERVSKQDPKISSPLMRGAIPIHLFQNKKLTQDESTDHWTWILLQIIWKIFKEAWEWKTSLECYLLIYFFGFRFRACGSDFLCLWTSPFVSFAMYLLPKDSPIGTTPSKLCINPCVLSSVQTKATLIL